MYFLLLWVALVGGKIETEMFRADSAIAASQMCEGLKKMEVYYQKRDGKKKAKALCQLWMMHEGTPLLIGDLE